MVKIIEFLLRVRLEVIQKVFFWNYAVAVQDSTAHGRVTTLGVSAFQATLPILLKLY